MNFNKTTITAITHHLPEQVLTSQNIEEQLAPLYKRLKLPEGRLELMTGISERRYWEKGTKPSDIATTAALKAINQSQFNKNDIDLLIHSSVCRDFLEPSTASVIHAKMGLSEHCMVFDLSNACLGMINSMVVAANMIERDQIRSALIVSGENGGPLLLNTIEKLIQDQEITRKSLKKYIANLTIGSAGCAILLTHSKLNPQGPKLLGGSVQTDSNANELCQGDGSVDSLEMQTDSEALLVAGTQLAKSNWNKTKDLLGWKNSDIHWAIGHQVGKAHERLTMDAMGLGHAKTHRTYPTLGNTGSAALPLTFGQLMEQKENGPLKKDKIALLGIGSGLTSIMLGVQW